MSTDLVDPEQLRVDMLKLVLRVSVVVGFIVYVPSVYFALRHGLVTVVVVDTIALLSAVGVLVFERLPFRLRAGVICTIYYALGVALLMGVGSISQIYLFGFSVVTVVLLGLRAGLGSALLSSITLLVVGTLGYASREMRIPNWSSDFKEWLVITLNFALVNVLITLAVGAVLSAVTNALAQRDRLLGQLQLQIERMPLAYLLSDRHLHFTRWNPAAERMFGYTETEVLGKHPFDVITSAESKSAVQERFDAIKTGSMNANGESLNRTKEGTLITCEWHNTPMFDDAGAFSGLLSLAQDVTERKKLEGQLRQAQKMEAVGQLAGGIAHDFNNLLSVVLSYSDMLIADLGENDSTRPMVRDVEEIKRAGLRASDLTKQLLMFSRKQVIQPKVLDLNELFANLDKMLIRIVGEHIEFASICVDDLGRARADPGSIEQVIMNLVVNARDAMPAGGKLTLESANVVLDDAFAHAHLDAKPGPYVMFSISDTGIGMSKATLARIFEPYFTTKEVGKGTGLGLSTVFGIVQRSGGFVCVDSELGVGTTFAVYLPRVDEEVDSARSGATAATLRGTETVLLVEDEDQVRDVASGILQRHGYHVLAAHNAGEALLFCEQHEGAIELLLTDVVMPQMGGLALAKRLAKTRPEMRVLYMSGYTDDVATRQVMSDATFAYLQKPLTVETLTRKVRGVLDH